MVKVENINYSYGRSSDQVLTNIGFDINDGECVAILGNNGAGKSTLLKCIDKINPTKESVVIVDGKNIFEMNSRTTAQHIAYVPQNIGAVDLTVFDTVLLGRKPYIKWDATEEDREIAVEIIHQMGLDSYTLRNVSELSGGEAQKVFMARALAQQPRFLLLDEPTSNLDPKNQHEVLQVVTAIAKKNNICVLIIIHDLNLAVRYCDRFLFLKDSKVYCYGGTEVLTEETISTVYDMKAKIIDCDGIPVIVPYPKNE
ncbi:MAG: ABC transporter ATP-binding protein [Clostridia bacterium]|nr:ABC transporter ATP-binding protein [Clostridia bacterium]